MRWFFEWVTIEGIILVSLGLAFVVTVLIIGLFAYYRSKYTFKYKKPNGQFVELDECYGPI
jgi:hypothetical protein